MYNEKEYEVYSFFSCKGGMSMKEKIGTIARYTGLPAHTIKYYESMGLIDNIRDEQSNYRYYELNQRTIIHECVHYRKLDFSIKDTEYMIKEANERQAIDCFNKHLNELDEKIHELNALYEMVKQSKDELQEFIEKENEWYVERVDPMLIYWQTDGVEWMKGRELDKAGIDFDQYDTRNVARINKHTIGSQKLEYQWGRSVDAKSLKDNTYNRELVQYFSCKRAYVTFIKVDEAIASGKVIELLNQIFIQNDVFKTYPNDIYFKRLKMVLSQGKPVSYYKVIIPL